MDDQRSEAMAAFCAIASVDSHTADTYLAATDYNVDQAVDLFFANAMEGPASGPRKQSDAELAQMLADGNGKGHSGAAEGASDPDYVRAPIPAKLDRLYEDLPSYAYPRQNGQHASQREVNAFRDFEAEARRERGRGLRGSSSSRQQSAGLGAMFEPPVDIMFRGNFEEGLNEAQKRNLWLDTAPKLVNVQSNQEFASHQLNRDTWSDATVKAILNGSFIFLQVDISSEDGEKFQAYYKVFDLPAIVVVDPITGSAMKTLTNFISAERLMEELVLYMDHSPEDPSAQKLTTAQHKRKITPTSLEDPQVLSEDQEMEQALALSMASAGPDAQEPANDQRRADQPASSSARDREDQGQEMQGQAVKSQSKKANIVQDPKVVQEEARASLPPPDASGESACRVRIRFPDGSNKTHNFSKHHTVTVLRTFCIAHSTEAASGRSFNLLQSGRGPAVALTDETQTLGEAGLANSLVAMTWTK